MSEFPTQAQYKRLSVVERKALKLSPHFSAWECECKCGCGLYMPKRELLDALEALRAKIGKPIITRWGTPPDYRSGSVCRCVTHNRNIGGAVDSRHLLFEAADCRVNGMSPHALAIAALDIPAFRQGGIIWYPTRGFVHLDVGRGNRRPLLMESR
jgi:hypothetical protein